MWYKKSIALLSVIFIGHSIYAQQDSGGGSAADVLQVREEITPVQREAIKRKLQQNENALRLQGKLPVTLSPMAQAFVWPIKQMLNYNDPGFYGISNYIDENTSFPNQVLDYNCGNRSYDQSSGYNHLGTDIFTWPFCWDKMNNNKVQVVAAAPGTIIGKDDGNYDQNCAFCSGSCNWNAVYVLHADGSVAWYGHLKAASLTTKNVGATVAEGEYLGIVGSSGNSTGPHLHLEVYTNTSYTQLVDPWAGPCNSLNGNTSWWASQQNYYVPTLSKVMTGSAAPQTSQCPNGEFTNQKINFASGQIIYLSSYYRDQLPGDGATHALYMPDGSLYLNWSATFDTYFSASYWWFSRTLPSNAQSGIWRYEVVFDGIQKLAAYFSVNDAAVAICPNNDNVLTANINGSIFQWQVDTGMGFINISNGTNYSGVNNAQLTIKNAPSSFYGYKYRCVESSLGQLYSNILSLKFTSYWVGTKNDKWEEPANWSCGNVPDANTDVVINSGTPNMPVVSSMAFCRSTRLFSASAIRVNTGFNLTITGK
ncbi:MAG: M23 family metallopeptidase [Bacteroidota bacterium]